MSILGKFAAIAELDNSLARDVVEMARLEYFDLCVVMHGSTLPDLRIVHYLPVHHVEWVMPGWYAVIPVAWQAGRIQTSEGGDK